MKPKKSLHMARGGPCVTTIVHKEPTRIATPRGSRKSPVALPHAGRLSARWFAMLEGLTLWAA
eukprot:7023722-Lingulodinium_polyedra.AAC.1